MIASSDRKYNCREEYGSLKHWRRLEWFPRRDSEVVPREQNGSRGVGCSSDYCCNLAVGLKSIAKTMHKSRRRTNVIESKPSGRQSSMSSCIHQVRNGSDSAVARLWRRVSPQLHRLAEGRAPQPDQQSFSIDHEQVALDAFGSAVTGIRDHRLEWVKNRNQFVALLHTIVRRKTARAVEARRRRPLGGMQWTAEPRCTSSRQQLREELEHILLQLPNSLSQEVLICLLDGRSQKEIATMLTISERTVRRKVEIIRQVFRKEIEAR